MRAPTSVRSEAAWLHDLIVSRVLADGGGRPSVGFSSMVDTLGLPVGCAGIPNLVQQRKVVNGGDDGRPSVVAPAP